MRANIAVVGDVLIILMNQKHILMLKIFAQNFGNQKLQFMTFFLS